MLLIPLHLFSGNNINICLFFPLSNILWWERACFANQFAIKKGFYQHSLIFLIYSFKPFPVPVSRLEGITIFILYHAQEESLLQTLCQQLGSPIVSVKTRIGPLRIIANLRNLLSLGKLTVRLELHQQSANQQSTYTILLIISFFRYKI